MSLKKLHNMTTNEIDKRLKEKGIYNTYGYYSRESKINKILGR